MGTFKSKILIYSLLLGSFPTILIGFFSYFIAAKDVEEKVNEGNMHLLNQTRMRVEQVLDSMQRTALQFENSSLLKSVMDSKLSGQDFIKVRELTKEMFNLQTQTILNQVYVVNLKHEWVVDLNSLKPLEGMNKAEFDRYLNTHESIFWAAGSGEIPQTSNPAETDYWNSAEQTATTLRLVHKLPLLSKNAAPSGILILQITAKDIRSMLEPVNLRASQYILNEQGEAFLSPVQDREAYRSINGEVLSRIGQSVEPQGAFHAESEGNKVSVLYTKSDYNGWTYVSVVSLDKVTDQTGNIALITAAACFGIIVTVLIASWFGSRRMYSPIRKLHEFATNVQPQQTDDYRKDEFESIRESLTSLAVSRNELDKQMKSQTVHLREFYVLKLFTEHMSGADDQYASERYGFPTGWGSLGVLQLELDNLQQSRFQEQDRELLLFAVSNIVSETLPVEARFSPIVLNHSQVTLLTSNEKSAEAGLAMFYETAQHIKAKVHEYLGLECSIGISHPFKRLSDAKRAYKESSAALKLRFILGSNIIVRYADIEDQANTEKTVYTKLRLIEDQMMLAMEERQLEKVEQLFQRYLDKLLCKDGFHQEHHLLLLQLASRTVGIAQEQGLSMQQVWNGEEELKHLFRLQTRTEIASWFHSRLFKPVIEILEDMADKQFVNITRRIVDIVQEQYGQDISLDYCAAVMNFNPAYISRVFKKEMGVSFSEYISEYRMNIAKNLLATTEMKVSEIGRKVSYTNISAFIRTFRRAFGLTPGQYREQLNSEEGKG
ncbi:AraC family transcriptional regulator [Paenibacillus sp. Y412MC10]|uniref:AraC family transcriptional regulator n=1 Tax=Geobacillus sp. (strain Y412MC10) TaxID=481743 RepID=UPI0001B9ED0F|nr:AraC family transcriptional regulator [Paenibacillus sp. Y412MC10]ACX65091.1 transcriptional regulator, AraC family [Paenibacillus sp. Y412MC10]